MLKNNLTDSPTSPRAQAWQDRSGHLRGAAANSGGSQRREGWLTLAFCIPFCCGSRL